MSQDLNIDVRAYPIENPQGSTVAFASVTFCVGDTPVNAINSIRVVEGEKGAFVAMPQTTDRNGEFQDVAFPVMKGLRGNMSKADPAQSLMLYLKPESQAAANEPHFHLRRQAPRRWHG